MFLTIYMILALVIVGGVSITGFIFGIKEINRDPKCDSAMIPVCFVPATIGAILFVLFGIILGVRIDSLEHKYDETVIERRK